MVAASATGDRVTPTMRARMWNRGGRTLAVAVILATLPRMAAHAQRVPGDAPRTAMLIVAGVGGEKRLADTFYSWASTLATAASARFGIPDSLVVVLAEDSTRPLVRGRSTRENIVRQLARLAESSRAGDRLVVVLFGHGGSQQGDARFNVPGPDISSEDFREGLRPLGDGAVLLFVNTASASGDFVKTLAGTNRIVVTATRSGREQNETLFPSFFVPALTSDVADGDKDGRASLLEAFTYARGEVERVFVQGNRIATEHALLEDDGDGVGHSNAGESGPDGLRARAFLLAPAGGATLAADPRAAHLLAERRAIEGRIERLRSTRATMTEAEYQRAIEPLLVELAETTRALRALEGRKP